MQGFCLGNGLCSGGGLPYHLGLGERIQQAMQALAKEGVIIGNEDTKTLHAYSSSWGTPVGMTTSLSALSVRV